MYKKKTFLAIILARGGSKRLPNKNILNFKKKPLIAHTIKAALKSKYIDEVIVSSDSKKILKVSKQCGANIIKRPKELASDTSSSMDAVHHVLKNTKNYDFVILLQPTSPLRKAKHIDKAIKFLHKKRADAVISVCECEHSPLWTNTLPQNKNMENFLPDKFLNVRSQDLPTYYRLNGSLYVCKREKLLHHNSFFIKKNIFAFIMKQRASIDIDTIDDFKIAEAFA